MVIEIVRIDIHPQMESAFEEALQRAEAILLAGGSTKVQLWRGVERPSHYQLHIEWDTVDAHVAFTKTDGIHQFRALVGPFFADKPHMEHFRAVPYG